MAEKSSSSKQKESDNSETKEAKDASGDVAFLYKTMREFFILEFYVMP